MTFTSTFNATIDEIPAGTKLKNTTTVDKKNSPNDSLGTSKLRSLKKKIRVEGSGVSEIFIPMNLRREALRMANLVANKWVEPSDTKP